MYPYHLATSFRYQGPPANVEAPPSNIETRQRRFHGHTAVDHEMNICIFVETVSHRSSSRTRLLLVCITGRIRISGVGFGSHFSVIYTFRLTKVALVEDNVTTDYSLSCGSVENSLAFLGFQVSYKPIFLGFDVKLLSFHIRNMCIYHTSEDFHVAHVWRDATLAMARVAVTVG